ncbi:MAG: alpha-mannosidase [Clostridia bacterium]|nr:alpha-mannosidase [Clostridia bacterium]
MSSRTLHFISHSHWDREWYMPFEAHRYKLVEFFDRLLDTLDNDPAFKSFHLDGQTIMIEDYLEIRPQMREKIEKYIAEGRLVNGPWYILQDEYLTDGESNIRNMLIGRQVAAQYGKVANVGYFPDAFGNIGQAPQILRGFGIDTVAFGRGVAETHGDMYDTGEANYGKAKSEILWRSPDGSEVMGAVFQNWYNNANEIPADPEDAAERIRAIRDAAERCATTPHLLMMNGCDHQPVQCDIGRILEKVTENGFEDTLVHSNFADYFEAIKPYRDNFGIYVGELNGENSNGWGTLANTASARIYLKQYNAQCQSLLEKGAEPLSVLSHLYAGKPADRDYFRWLWKTLMQNHPHDSICGCSVDDVHEEMVTRFKKVLHAGNSLLNEEKSVFASTLNTAGTGAPYAVTVFNPAGHVSSEAVSCTIDLPEDTDVTAGMLSVLDGENAIPADVTDLGIVSDYILPKDTFRVPFKCRRFKLSFRAADVPALGWKTFGISVDGAKPAESDLTVYKRGMQNRRLRVKIARDGSISVTDRKTGASYVTGIFVDTGDRGEEYNYREAHDMTRITTEGTAARVELYSASAASVTFRIVHKMQIPAGIDENGCRCGECEMVIENYCTLREGARRLDFRTVIHNQAENHRVVVHTRHGIVCDNVTAEGQFDFVKRAIVPCEHWQNPMKPGKMTTFFSLEDGTHGLNIAGRGLCEYEVLRDEHRTMALTLHRGVAELGDWNYFPTPGAQCKGTLTVEYSLVPYAPTVRDRENAVNDCYSFAAYEPAAVSGPVHEGANPASGSLVGLSGHGFIVSAVKMAEDRDSVILRVFNPYDSDAKMKLGLGETFASAYLVNLGEERMKKIPCRDGSCTVSLLSKKIVTVELVPAK